MNWKIGMKVVCVKPHSLGMVQKGNVYTIQGVETCGCGLCVDVGVIWPGCSDLVCCTECGGIRRNNGKWTFINSLFRPLEEFDKESWIETIEQNSLPKEHPVFSKIKERVDK